MRAFLTAVIAAFVIAATAAFVLERIQKGYDVANTSAGAVIDLEKEGVKHRGW